MATRHDPISVHAFDDLESIFGHLLRFLGELQLLAVFVDERLQLDQMLMTDVLVVDVELLAHVFVHFAQSKDVDVYQLGNVHQENLVVGLATAGSVEAGSDNFIRLATSGEVDVGCKSPDLICLNGDIVGNAQLRTELFQSSTTSVLNVSKRVPLAASDFAICSSSEGPGVTGVVVDGSTLNSSPTSSLFLKGDFGDDVGFVDLSITMFTNGKTVVFGEFGAATVGRRADFDGVILLAWWRTTRPAQSSQALA